MPKVRENIDLSEYAPVADRITAFYARYPKGRIMTELVRDDGDVVFKAIVYRDTEEREPASTGWAKERVGDGDVNLVACVENTETSAIGRALANLGFTASKRRASREEMVKAARARMRYQREQDVTGKPPEPAESETDHGAMQDFVDLINEAETMGFPRDRAAVLRETATQFPLTDPHRLAQLKAQLRRWMREHTV